MDRPFCTLPPERIVKANAYAVLIRDAYPVSPGHCLVIPTRHVASWFETSEEERQSMLALLDEAKSMVDAELAPDSYNIGVNDGPAAGQTVPHLHMHLIPRYRGDLPDPRGGVRWVIPEKPSTGSPSASQLRQSLRITRPPGPLQPPLAEQRTFP